MKVFVNNKAFSLTGASKVVDENKQPIFNVKGKFLSIRKKKRVCDLDGKVLYRVQNKFFNMFEQSAYILDANKNKVAKVVNKLFDAKGSYIVEDCEDEIMVEGKIFSLESKIIKNGEVIGTIKRDLGFMGDHFVLDAETDNLPFLIALVIAIDNISDRKSRQSR